MPQYRCHECGGLLERIRGCKMLRCERCAKWRAKPTHPALIVPDGDVSSSRLIQTTREADGSKNCLNANRESHPPSGAERRARNVPAVLTCE